MNKVSIFDLIPLTTGNLSSDNFVNSSHCVRSRSVSNFDTKILHREITDVIDLIEYRRCINNFEHRTKFYSLSTFFYLRIAVGLYYTLFRQSINTYTAKIHTYTARHTQLLFGICQTCRGKCSPSKMWFFNQDEA